MVTFSIPSKVMRCRFGAVLLCTSIAASTGASADDAVTRANRGAYDWAVKCFVANGSARGTSNDAGDTAKAAAFERRARASFDTASALADKLGYSGSRLDQDLGLAQAQELPKFVRDITYLRNTLATCKGLGL
jgi:hypothetical protein